MKQLPKLLITGASGFTGRHACSHFSKAGFEVTAVTRNHAIKDQVQIEQCNLAVKDAVRRLVKKVKPQYLLHLAGQNHVGQSWLDPVSSLEANTMSTLYLIDALRQESPACKIVVVGSALQFDLQNISTLTHPYSLSKTLQVLIAKSWERLYNMHIVIAKPTNLIGPGFSNGVCSIFAKKIADMELSKSEKVLEVNNLYAQHDFVDVRDAVIAYETLLMKGISGETYEIASGTSRSLKEIIDGFKAITKVGFEVKSQPNNQIGQPIEILPLKLMELGWKPTIPLESSLKDILNFYHRNKRV